MSTELAIAFISACVAVISASVGAYTTHRTARLSNDFENAQKQLERQEERERVVSRFREPLARAAFDLQSRLYNILVLNLIPRHLRAGDERTRAYVIDNTAFLIAQYFAWTEIIRNEIFYVDLGRDEKTQQLSKHLDEITNIWGKDHSPMFRLFAGEQRALGEIMIRIDQRGPSCMGYAEFLHWSTTTHNVVLEGLRKDVETADSVEARFRLRALQHALIELLSMLDPSYLRFPEDRRQPVP